MKDALIDGQLQITAAVALLEHSRLVSWVPEANKFIPVTMEKFEISWQRSIDPVFGRLICWIAFSAGAEFFAKGTCLVQGVEIRTRHKVPAYPTGDFEHWAPEFLKDWENCGTLEVTNFGTIGSLIYKDPKTTTPSALERLCLFMKATSRERNLILAAYTLLARSIRNRDAHAYVANVRGPHFGLVPKLFTRCFNILVSWLPGDPSTLNQWRADAKELISAL